MLDAALAAVARGWWVFPLAPGGKRPLTKHGLLDAATDRQQLERWWTTTPEANVGISCGPSELIVIDVDYHEPVNGWVTFTNLADQAGEVELPRTLEVGTPSGGAHFYFSAVEGDSLRNSAGKLGPGVDVRACGGYVAGAGSKTPAGVYELLLDVDPLPLPQWIREPLLPVARPDPLVARLQAPEIKQNYAGAALKGECDRVAGCPAGGRNDQLNKSAFKIGSAVAAGLLDGVEAVEALLRAAAACGLGEAEAARTIASGLSAGRLHPRQAA